MGDRLKKSDEKAPAQHPVPVTAGAGVLLLFAFLFIVVYIVIAFVASPGATALKLKSDAYVSFVDKWGGALPFIAFLWGGLSFIIMLIVTGILKLAGFANAKTRSIAVLVGMLPWLVWGIQLVYYEKWWTDIARIVIPLVGYPLFMASWMVMAVALFYGIVGIVRKR